MEGSLSKGGLKGRRLVKGETESEHLGPVSHPRLGRSKQTPPTVRGERGTRGVVPVDPLLRRPLCRTMSTTGLYSLLQFRYVPSVRTRRPPYCSRRLRTQDETLQDHKSENVSCLFRYSIVVTSPITTKFEVTSPVTGKGSNDQTTKTPDPIELPDPSDLSHPNSDWRTMV